MPAIKVRCLPSPRMCPQILPHARIEENPCSTRPHPTASHRTLAYVDCSPKNHLTSSLRILGDRPPRRRDPSEDNSTPKEETCSSALSKRTRVYPAEAPYTSSLPKACESSLPTCCPHSCGCLKGVIMPRAPKRRRYSLENQEAEEEYYSSSSSTCSSSFPSSFSSSSPSSSSSSRYLLLSSNPSTPEYEEQEEEEVHAAAGTLSPTQSSPLACAPPTAIDAAAPLSQSSSQEEEGPSTSRALPDTESLPRDVIDDKVADLVGFLLRKYRTQELTTKVEMLSSVIREHQDHFAGILSKASEYMQLVYGTDVKEVDRTSHTYVLVTNVGLTYDGMVNHVHSMPKTGLLILILSIIFTEDDCVPERRYGNH